MAIVLIDKERTVIPRWRDFRTTVAIGELKSSAESEPALQFPKGDFLASKVRDWSNNKDIPHAADLVSAAFVLKRYQDAREAAEFLIAKREHVPSTVKSFAYQIIHPLTDAERVSVSNEIEIVDPEQIQKRIHSLRRRLRDEPRNTIAYVDLARFYTLLDQSERAKRAIEMALKLDSQNRFVLRSATRFFIHINRAERAHQILRRSDASKSDPWLMAAEIAVSSAAGGSSRFAKTGQRIIADDHFKPSELTELASAIATLELENGKARDARKLFRKALVSPTENSVAQVEWASRRIAGLDEIRVSQFNNVPRVYEAQAWEHYTSGNWVNALEESWKWSYDQPFSSRPISFGSYVASTVLGDYQQGVRILKLGRIANPDDPMLLNNLAFACASLGDTRKAQEAFDQINLSKVLGAQEVVVTATEGLLAFRSGRIAEGRAHYLRAIEMASQYPKRYKIMASIYYAREEMLAKTIEAAKARELALELSSEVKDADVHKVVERELLDTNARID